MAEMLNSGEDVFDILDIYFQRHELQGIIQHNNTMSRSTPLTMYSMVKKVNVIFILKQM